MKITIKWRERICEDTNLFFCRFNCENRMFYGNQRFDSLRFLKDKQMLSDYLRISFFAGERYMIKEDLRQIENFTFEQTFKPLINILHSIEDFEYKVREVNIIGNNIKIKLY